MNHTHLPFRICELRGGEQGFKASNASDGSSDAARGCLWGSSGPENIVCSEAWFRV